MGWGGWDARAKSAFLFISVCIFSVLLLRVSWLSAHFVNVASVYSSMSHTARSVGHGDKHERNSLMLCDQGWVYRGWLMCGDQLIQR